MKARDKPRPINKTTHKHDFRFHEVVKGKGVRFKCACGETMLRITVVTVEKQKKAPKGDKLRAMGEALANSMKK